MCPEWASPDILRILRLVPHPGGNQLRAGGGTGPRHRGLQGRQGRHHQRPRLALLLNTRITKVY